MAFRDGPSGYTSNLGRLHRDRNYDMRYSYAEGPDELHRPIYQESSPPNSVIDESPTSPRGEDFPDPATNRHPVVDSSAATCSRDRHNFKSLHNIHPAHFAPFAEPTEQPADPAAGTEPQSPWPLPTKIQEDAIPSPVPIHDSVFEKRTADLSKLAPPNTHQSPVVYSPDSFAGPNAALENHRPGQVSHPNAAVEPEWKHGLCEVDTLCCAGLFCPCIVYGKTQHRLSRKDERKDATDLLGYETCNGSCGVMAAACGFQWIFTLIQRTRIRKLYHLNGDFKSDCLKGLCCCCCVLMQDEREVRDREDLIRRYAGPGGGPYGYTAPSSMTYAPPPR